MTTYLIDNEKAFLMMLAARAWREIYMTEDDKCLQERMRKQNEAEASRKFGEFMSDIHSRKQGDLINWEYLKKNNPKKYKKFLEIRQKEIEMRKAGIEAKWKTFPNTKKKTKEVA